MCGAKLGIIILFSRRAFVFKINREVSEFYAYLDVHSSRCQVVRYAILVAVGV